MNQPSSPPQWFVAALMNAQTKYLGAKITEANIRGYWDELRNFQPKTVAQAVKAAVAQSQQFYPSASLIKAQCHQVARRRNLEDQTDRILRPDRQLSDRKSPAEDNRAPKTPQAQMDYVAAAKDPFERMARLWECENNNNRTMDGETLPPMRDLNERRIKEFNRVMDKHWPDKGV